PATGSPRESKTRPVIRKVAGFPTRTATWARAVPPFMSLTSSETKTSPVRRHDFETVFADVLDVLSPNSHRHVRESPSGSLARAVKVNNSPAAADVGAFCNVTEGG